MIVRYHKEKLTRIVEDIFNLTGISISILDTDYHRIATSSQKQEYCRLLQTVEAERKRCLHCDKNILDACRRTGQLEYYICRAGLYDCAMPIVKHDTVIAFVIMGQIRSADSPPTPDYLPDTDACTVDTLDRLYSKTPFMTERQLLSLYDLLPHILFNDAIEIVHDPFIDQAVKFIDENLTQKISISDLCETFHVSKNYLYVTFRNNLNNTVTGYVNEQRIRRAQELLERTNESVYQIAESVGIGNYTYFCKLFKKLNGVTPTEYRKKDRSGTVMTLHSAVARIHFVPFPAYSPRRWRSPWSGR